MPAAIEGRLGASRRSTGVGFLELYPAPAARIGTVDVSACIEPDVVGSVMVKFYVTRNVGDPDAAELKAWVNLSVTGVNYRALRGLDVGPGERVVIHCSGAGVCAEARGIEEDADA